MQVIGRAGEKMAEILVPSVGLEPTTYRLQDCSSH